MKPQTYATHRHSPTLTNAGSAFLLLAIAAFALRWFDIGGRYTMALGLLGLIGSISTLLTISRVYITRLQDRIIKLEMRIRCAPLLSPALQDAFGRLTRRQIVALRFASDEELPALIERADAEKLTPDQIKRAIRNWVPDWDRA
jgi:hypothetical protein